MGVFGALTQEIRVYKPVRVELFALRSLDAVIGSGFRHWLIRSSPYSSLISLQWIRAYFAFADGVGYRSISCSPIADAIDGWRAYRIWRGLRSIEHLEALSIDGLHCGDLVIDTYLRFKPSPLVELNDSFLAQVIWQAMRDIRRARNYFQTRQPFAYLTSYATYVQHGIAVRVALEQGIPVFSFGHYQRLAKRIDQNYPFHTQDPRSYKADFVRRNDQQHLLDQARQQLEMRLSGGIDAATAYMSNSAYAQVGQCPEVRDAVIVFLHDFFDSPHIFPNLLFPDFWTWACETIEILQRTGRRFLVKSHPNQVDMSSMVIHDLLRKYPELKLVPSNVSNRQLVEAGMSCGVTVYGTVVHELAYLGVPSVAAAWHPHIAFEFCLTAKTRNEYSQLLQDIDSLAFKNAELPQREALEFYAMHNLAMSAEDLQLRDLANRARRSARDAETPATAQTFIEDLEALRVAPGFQQFAQHLADLSVVGNS